MTKKIFPNVYSAAVTARVLSRRLRKAGFLMSGKEGDRLSEGLYVNRVGCSRSVCIDYYIPNYMMATAELKVKAQNVMTSVKKWLVENNYPLDPNTSGLWVICERK